MSRWEAVEVVIGLIAFGVGLSYYLGWALVLLSSGVVLVVGAVTSVWWRHRAAR